MKLVILSNVKIYPDFFKFSRDADMADAIVAWRRNFGFNSAETDFIGGCQTSFTIMAPCVPQAEGYSFSDNYYCAIVIN